MLANNTPFCGTYRPNDVSFLLCEVDGDVISVAEKESLMQSGQRHYSELISLESAPSEAYMQIFGEAMSNGAPRMASDIASIALALQQEIEGPITLVSFVRAGVPFGVLLKRALTQLGVDVEHYGISIILDRGIDDVAINYILERRPAAGVVFVDGWTGKGSIASEFEKVLVQWPQLEPRLVVLADPCGRAWLAASGDDWLIPSGMLGGIVSGLISRTILTRQRKEGQFHGCKFWKHLSQHDITRDFVDNVWKIVCDEGLLLKVALDGISSIRAKWDLEHRKNLQLAASATIRKIADLYSITNFNLIKPGIAEATRAVLRRVPNKVLVTSPDDPNLKGIFFLCNSVGVTVEVAGTLIWPYGAVTLIKKAE